MLELEYPPGNLLPRRLPIPLTDPLLTRQELVELVRTVANVRRHVGLRVAYRVAPPPAQQQQHASRPAAGWAAGRQPSSASSTSISNGGSGGTRTPTTCRPPLRSVESDATVAALMQDTLTYGSAAVRVVAVQSTRSPPPPAQRTSLSSSPVAVRTPAQSHTQQHQQQHRDVPLGVVQSPKKAPLPPTPDIHVRVSVERNDARPHGPAVVAAAAAAVPPAVAMPHAVRPLPIDSEDDAQFFPAHTHDTASLAREASGVAEEEEEARLIVRGRAATLAAAATRTAPDIRVVGYQKERDGVHVTGTMPPLSNPTSVSPREQTDVQLLRTEADSATPVRTPSPSEASSRQSHTRGPLLCSQDEDDALHAVEPQRLYAPSEAESVATAVAVEDEGVARAGHREPPQATVDDTFGETWRNPEYYGKHARERVTQQQQEQQQQQPSQAIMSGNATPSRPTSSAAAPSPSPALFFAHDNDAPVSMAGRSLLQRVPASAENQSGSCGGGGGASSSRNTLAQNGASTNEPDAPADKQQLRNAEATPLKAPLSPVPPRATSSVGSSSAMDPHSLVFVRYEVDPTAVFVAGPVSPVVLQQLQDVIYRRCCAHLSIDADAPRPRFHLNAESSNTSINGKREVTEESGRPQQSPNPKSGSPASASARAEYVLPLYAYRFTRVEERALECSIAEVMSVYQGLEQLPAREAEEWVQATSTMR